MSFWQKASIQQRLAQIDGAIECGLTYKQMAMNMACEDWRQIQYFANHHGRFSRNGSLVNHNQRIIRSSQVKQVSHNRSQGRPEVEAGRAFEIFPSKAKEDHILDKRGDE